MVRRTMLVAVWAGSLVIAAGATATAATLITGSQIKAGTITARNIAKGTVGPKQLSSNVQAFLTNEVFATYTVTNTGGTVAVDTHRSFDRMDINGVPIKAGDVTSPATGTYVVAVPDVNINGGGGELLNITTSVAGITPTDAASTLTAYGTLPEKTANTVTVHIVNAVGQPAALPDGASFGFLLT